MLLTVISCYGWNTKEASFDSVLGHLRVPITCQTFQNTHIAEFSKYDNIILVYKKRKASNENSSPSGLPFPMADILVVHGKGKNTRG